MIAITVIAYCILDMFCIPTNLAGSALPTDDTEEAYKFENNHCNSLRVIDISNAAKMSSRNQPKKQPYDLGASEDFCRRGDIVEYPLENQDCYIPDVDTNRSSPDSCAGYLTCKTSNCEWSFVQCSPTKYFNFREENCVDREQADCSAGIFGSELSVYVLNVGMKKSTGVNYVLTDCTDCPIGNTKMSPVVGFRRDPTRKWNQVYVVKIRGFSSYYSFAFDRMEGKKIKVLTEKDNELVSHMYEELKVTSPGENTDWKIVPIDDPSQHGIANYQILSVKTNLALTMTENTIGHRQYLQIALQIPNILNQNQWWKFIPAQINVKDDSGLSVGSSYPSFPSYTSSSPFLFTSEENFSNAKYLRGSQANRCQNKRKSFKNSNSPAPNSQCYQTDVNRKTAYPNNCHKFLQCDVKECKWLEYHCSYSQYWNNAEKKCVQSQHHATCGVEIFGLHAKVNIQNVEYGKVLHDGIEGQQEYSWQAQSSVIDFDKKSRPACNQVLIAKRRGDDEFYSLSFHNSKNDQVKVITDNGSSKPILELYNILNSSQAQWKFIPINRESKAYQIISSKNQALEMNKIAGQVAYKVRLSQPDEQNKRQQWLLEDAQTGEAIALIRH